MVGTPSLTCIIFVQVIHNQLRPFYISMCFFSTSRSALSSGDCSICKRVQTSSNDMSYRSYYQKYQISTLYSVHPLTTLPEYEKEQKKNKKRRDSEESLEEEPVQQNLANQFSYIGTVLECTVILREDKTAVNHREKARKFCLIPTDKIIQ
jgi:hypothetical protein